MIITCEIGEAVELVCVPDEAAGKMKRVAKSKTVPSLR